MHITPRSQLGFYEAFAQSPAVQARGTARGSVGGRPGALSLTGAGFHRLIHQDPLILGFSTNPSLQ